MDNNNPIEYNKQNQDKWSKFGFFVGDRHMHFVFKKSEKITSALYLVSGLLTDSEPLKWELREKAVLLLNATLSLNGVEPIDKGVHIQTLFSTAIETNALLGIALVGGLISEMNHNILVREIDAVATLVKDRLTEDTNRAGYVLSDSFFKTEEISQNNSLSTNQSTSTSTENSGNQSTGTFTSSTKNVLDKASGNKAIKDSIPHIKDKKESRQDSILNLLKKDSGLTIKDFAKVVVGCSEKTIQRELLELVEKGIIKKEGERRWSTYSLK
jgi:hypothetical protein